MSKTLRQHLTVDFEEDVGNNTEDISNEVAVAVSIVRSYRDWLIEKHGEVASGWQGKSIKSLDQTADDLDDLLQKLGFD